MTFESGVFRGVSVRFAEKESYEEASFGIAQSPVVKAVWPVHYYELPKTEFTPLQQLTPNTVSNMKRQTDDTFGPHVMMQVDKLRAKGITGKGIKVAVIDSGVSVPPSGIRTAQYLIKTLFLG